MHIEHIAMYVNNLHLQLAKKRMWIELQKR